MRKKKDSGVVNMFLDDQREGFSYNITCPCCNKEIWVNKKILRYE